MDILYTARVSSSITAVTTQDRQCAYNVTLSHGSCVEKLQVLRMLSVCVSVALVIQHAKRMLRIRLSFVPVWLY